MLQAAMRSSCLTHRGDLRALPIHTSLKVFSLRCVLLQPAPLEMLAFLQIPSTLNLQIRQTVHARQ